MTDLEALYRAVLEDPDDDTLRLVYADALEEEGDGRRAAFVRAQVELARTPEYDPAAVRARAARHCNPDVDWVLDLPDLPDGLAWPREPFRRGFPAALQARNAAAFVRHADDLFARYPIESLELSAARLADARQFARCPWVSRIVRLALDEGVGRETAPLLLGSKHFDRLRELHVGPGNTTPATATAIVRSRVFRQLTALGFGSDGRGGQTIVTELIQLADPPRLRSLDLSGNRLTPDRLGQLLAAPALVAVEELNFGDNNLGPEGMRVLAAARLPQLRGLHLLRTRPGVEGVEALAVAGGDAGLFGLTLGGNNLPAAAARVLARAPGLSNLRVLDLRENRLGDAGAAALADSPHLRNLVQLDLAENGIEDDGALALADSAHLAGLVCLDLHGNVISPPAAAALKRRFADRAFL
jgi:uncharacterized protein (TIGR02996 family)